MQASWKGIWLCLCFFQTVLGFSLDRLPDLSQPLASAAASSDVLPGTFLTVLLLTVTTISNDFTDEKSTEL